MGEQRSQISGSSRLKAIRLSAIIMLAGMVSACSTLGASGPSRGDIRKADAPSGAEAAIQVIDIDMAVLRSQRNFRKAASFAEVFGDSAASVNVIGLGDVVDIAIWEAPPAVLFGGLARASSGQPDVAGGAQIPQQKVGDDGTITVPFAGRIEVVGRKTHAIESEIKARLKGQAHDPQVVVRLVQNEARSVTVLGEVGANRLMPLSAKGERVLDAIASAGGSRHSVTHSTVQLVRGQTRANMPLQSVIEDPVQNVTLRADDVITVLHRPFSFVALGAVGRNAEIEYEGGGLSLAQALGRAGGLNSQNADVKGVFVFRREDPAALAALAPDPDTAFPNERIPVIYRLNMAEPASLFAMQDFSIEDDDVIYISTAPGVDLQRFISTLSGAAFSVVGIANAVQDKE